MAKSKKKRAEKRAIDWKKTLTFELGGLGILAVAIIALADIGGVVGKALIQLARFFFGEWYSLLLIGLFFLSIYFIVKRKWPSFFTRRLAGIYTISAALLLYSHVEVFNEIHNQAPIGNPSIIQNTWNQFWSEVKGGTSKALGGGMAGALLFAISYFLFGALGTKIIFIFLILIGLILLTGISIHDLFSIAGQKFFQFLKTQWIAFVHDCRSFLKGRKKKRINENRTNNESYDIDENKQEMIIVEQAEELSEEPIISDFNEIAGNDANAPTTERSDKNERNGNNNQSNDGNENGESQVAIDFTQVTNESYQLPPLELLKKPVHNNQNQEKKLISINAQKLEKTFESFGVKAKVRKVHLGPAVTKYEVHPDVGVKVSKIVSLSDDLALALAAKDIRIEAPIPGKSAIGIEVPNQEVAMVTLREVLESKNNRPEAKLMVGLGRDISGEAILAELNKMPHLLVAGATGSGKSVCINGIIISLIMRAKPHEVKLMMIDPKMVELNMYNGIPHLLTPVVTDPKKASQALKKVVAEMERRYELFSHTGTRNIEGYNEHVRIHNEKTGEKQPELPYIVVIVDELADLMMVASSDVEEAITRLAQMARAAGIHLIIATQRPSVDVITGVIKANIPSRIAFSVSSSIDSRTILDMGGAEKLLGRGDMLFLPVGASKPIRIQGAFVSDAEVEEVVEHVISQQKAQYQEDMMPSEESDVEVEIDDELFNDAVDLVVEMQTASVSMLQRRFRIGYTRAARLIDAMEAKGIVGPYEGSKPRAVLISKTKDEVSN
ncbi:DNA translocase FtsK [Calidifontibacillus erzurumensis]|uniref:DNA translocase FtsK n=1 Tax=Calidifontibacillus erzurumensis TaxID=2741433 RepID=A0A8J8GC66_9BACI|nr:DNA translocase FtsK [Calidifontibacillus erzurumensis]NSL51124.1 DNA translocase FtsK [Calidifontibacillus erzurumensis]